MPACTSTLHNSAGADEAALVAAEDLYEDAKHQQHAEEDGDCHEPQHRSVVHEGRKLRASRQSTEGHGSLGYALKVGLFVLLSRGSQLLLGALPKHLDRGLQV